MVFALYLWQLSADMASLHLCEVLPSSAPPCPLRLRDSKSVENAVEWFRPNDRGGYWG